MSIYRTAETAHSTLGIYQVVGPNGEISTGFALERNGPDCNIKDCGLRIAPGNYDINWTWSDHFQQNMYEVDDLSGSNLLGTRAGIRLHNGQHYGNSIGCILVGGQNYGVENGDYTLPGNNTMLNCNTIYDAVGTNPFHLLISDRYLYDY